MAMLCGNQFDDNHLLFDLLSGNKGIRSKNERSRTIAHHKGFFGTMKRNRTIKNVREVINRFLKEKL